MLFGRACLGARDEPSEHCVEVALRQALGKGPTHVREQFMHCAFAHFFIYHCPKAAFRASRTTLKNVVRQPRRAGSAVALRFAIIAPCSALKARSRASPFTPTNACRCRTLT